MLDYVRRDGVWIFISSSLGSWSTKEGVRYPEQVNFVIITNRDVVVVVFLILLSPASDNVYRAMVQ